MLTMNSTRCSAGAYHMGYMGYHRTQRTVEACVEGAGAINDLCFLHERCAPIACRGRVGLHVAASVSLDWECVVVLLVGARMVASRAH